MEATGSRWVKVNLADGRTCYPDLAKCRCWLCRPDFDMGCEKSFTTYLYQTPGGRFVREVRYDCPTCITFDDEIPPPDEFELFSPEESLDWFLGAWQGPGQGGPDPDPRYEAEMPAEVLTLLKASDLDAASPSPPAAPPRPGTKNGPGAKAPPDPVAELRKNRHARPAALVEFMWDRESATFQEIAEHVHGDRAVSAGAIKGNVTRTNEHLEAMGQPLRFKVGSFRIFKDEPPA